MSVTTGITFDDVYDIRLATIKDIPMIMTFIDSHWKKGHIMGNNRAFFEYEFVHGDDVDFIIAIKKATQTLEAIFGFLRCSKQKNGDIWGSMWKVNDESDNMNLLGIEIAKRVYDLTGCHYYCGNGANPKTTVPLRKLFFREKTVKMQQFYWLNSNRAEYKIAEINTKWAPTRKEGTPRYEVRKFENFESLSKEFNVEAVRNTPHKDSWYINKRYFHHPVYHYDAYGIYDGDVVKAIFFTREVSAEGSSVLRIVDYIGEHEMLSGIFDAMESLVKAHNYEYIDFFEFGVDDRFLYDAGFKNREDDDNIIPNYFEPFVRKNVDIWAHYKLDGTTFFKADGDQDRPNFA